MTARWQATQFFRPFFKPISSHIHSVTECNSTYSHTPIEATGFNSTYSHTTIEGAAQSVTPRIVTHLLKRQAFTV